MKTTEISIWEENDESSESGRTVSAWGFTLNGERFGGYCATQAEARSDAERILEGELDTLTPEQIDTCYTELVGYAPIAGDGMSEDDARQLLFDRMGES
jgi:hypothetical protein